MKVRITRLLSITFLFFLFFISYKISSNILKSESNDDKIKPDFRHQVKQLNYFLLQPTIFIGGSMSSGTSLVRSILDVHPSVKCGPETKFINILLDYLKTVYTTDRNSLNFMKAAGIKNDTLDKSIGLAVYYVMLMNVERNVERLCNKETSNRRHINFFKNVFPNSKFILVIRDGREVAFSFVKRLGGKITFKRFFNILKKWNNDNIDSYNQCVMTGKDYCMILRYESLVKNPEIQIRKMINFLGVEWNNRVLNHEKYVQSEVKMSKSEWSKKGMQKKIYSESLKNWVGNVPNYDEELVEKNITLLKFLKYI